MSIRVLLPHRLRYALVTQNEKDAPCLPDEFNSTTPRWKNGSTLSAPSLILVNKATFLYCEEDGTRCHCDFHTSVPSASLPLENQSPAFCDRQSYDNRFHSHPNQKHYETLHQLAHHTRHVFHGEIVHSRRTFCAHSDRSTQNDDHHLGGHNAHQVRNVTSFLLPPTPRERPSLLFPPLYAFFASSYVVTTSFLLGYGECQHRCHQDSRLCGCISHCARSHPEAPYSSLEIYTKSHH
jgi:hypothetical protein